MSSPVGPSQATQSSSYPGTPDEEFEGYFSNVHAAAEAFILGQGYESVSQDRLRRIMNKDWIKLCTSIPHRTQPLHTIWAHPLISQAAGYQSDQDLINKGQRVYHEGLGCREICGQGECK